MRIRTALLAPLSLLALHTPPAAAAYSHTAECHVVAVREYLGLDLDGNEWFGVLAGAAVVHEDGSALPTSVPVGLECLVRVNSFPVVTTGLWTGTAVTPALALPILFPATHTDVVELCTRVVLLDGTTFTCVVTNKLQVPPQEVIDLANDVIGTVYEAGKTSLEPTLCPALGGPADCLSAPPTVGRMLDVIYW